MKKLFTLALMAGISATAFAHRHATVANLKPATNITTQHVAAAKTTQSGLMLIPFSFVDTSCHFYNSQIDDTSGYIGGINMYGDLQKMMRYSLDSFGLQMPATVDTVKMVFSNKFVSGNGALVAKVYAANGAGQPGALLGTSSNISVSSIDTTGNFTNFIFAAPVSITTDQFFVSLDLTGAYLNGDTAAVYIQADCSAIDTMQAWDQLSNNTYLPASSAANWGFPVNYAIYPVITADPLAIKNVATTIFGAKVFPNPAAADATVSFTSPANGNTQIQLKDITGKTVISQTVATIKGQSYNEKLDVSTLSSGLYFCEIISGANRGVIKVTVQ